MLVAKPWQYDLSRLGKRVILVWSSGAEKPLSLHLQLHMLERWQEAFEFGLRWLHQFIGFWKTPLKSCIDGHDAELFVLHLCRCKDLPDPLICWTCGRQQLFLLLLHRLREAQKIFRNPFHLWVLIWTWKNIPIGVTDRLLPEILVPELRFGTGHSEILHWHDVFLCQVHLRDLSKLFYKTACPNHCFSSGLLQFLRRPRFARLALHLCLVMEKLLQCFSQLGIDLRYAGHGFQWLLGRLLLLRLWGTSGCGKVGASSLLQKKSEVFVSCPKNLFALGCHRKYSESNNFRHRSRWCALDPGCDFIGPRASVKPSFYQKHFLQQSLRSDLPTDQCGGKHGAVISKSTNLYEHTSCSSRNIKKQDKHIKNTTHQNTSKQQTSFKQQQGIALLFPWRIHGE